MNSRILAVALCICSTILVPSGFAQLVPGDFAVTRIQNDRIVIMALRDLPGNELIEVTDREWINGQFVASSGDAGSFSIPSAGLAPGRQLLVDLGAMGIDLDWEKTLHFYQEQTPPFASNQPTYVQHLLVIEFSLEGLRWWTNIPDGLIPDVTHIVIRQDDDDPGVINHVLRSEFASAQLTPYRWLRALGNFRAWDAVSNYPSLPSIGIFAAEIQFEVTPHPGMISLPFSAQNYKESEGQIFVPIRRSFGSQGNALVELVASNQIQPFARRIYQTLDDYNADLTAVAFGDGVGFVAVSPDSGTLLMNDSGNWTPVFTNDDPGLNLRLSGIIHDGSSFWACSTDGRIYKSEDGKYWETVFDADQGGTGFFRMHFLEGANFPYIAVGANGLLAFSDDGGNWGLSNTGTDSNLFGAAYFEESYVVCGENGLLLSTRDVVEGPWSVVPTPTTRTLFDVATVRINSGSPSLLAVGRFGTMIETSSLKNSFVQRTSNTNRSLFAIIDLDFQATGTNYVFAVGENGVTTYSEDGGAFVSQPMNPRAPALYALAQYNGGSKHELFAVGEYGSVVRFNPDSGSLSGSIADIDLEGQGNTVDLLWESGESGDRYVKMTKSSGLSENRERIDLRLRRPSSPGSGYHLGNDRSEINFFRSVAGRTNVVANSGPMLKLITSPLEVLNDDAWRLSFRIFNTSEVTSGRLFIRFKGTNLPDFEIPNGETSAPGSRLGPLERTGNIEYTLRQPVETIALYEVFKDNNGVWETILKAETAINSLVANPNWQPNGFLPRSLGVYLQESSNSNLSDPGIPGIDDPAVNGK